MTDPRGGATRLYPPAQPLLTMSGRVCTPGGDGFPRRATVLRRRSGLGRSALGLPAVALRPASRSRRLAPGGLRVVLDAIVRAPFSSLDLSSGVDGSRMWQ
jgi:hypothetical protein